MAKEKAKQVVQSLREIKLKEPAAKIKNGMDETLTYMGFPSDIGQDFIQTMGLNAGKEIRRRTRVVGIFQMATRPDASLCPPASRCCNSV